MRQAALRGASPTTRCSTTTRAEDPRQLRQGGAHDHRLRQRHRHVARGGRSSTSAPSPSRARASSSSTLTGDQAKDAQPDRPVRRRLLLRLHRRRQRHADHAPRRRCRPTHGVRWESDRRGRLHASRPSTRPTRGTDVILHLRAGRGRAAVGLAAARRSSASTPTTSPLPILMKKEEWDADEEGARSSPTRTRRSTRRRALWARPKSEITEEQYDEFYKHVAHDFEPPLAWTHDRGRRPAGVHAAAVHPGARAVRPVGPRAAPRHQAVRPARLHHGRRRAAAAGLPALRARRGRLERPAAQRLARDPAAVARRRGDPRRRRVKRVLGLLDDLAENQPEKYATFWKEFGRVLKEGIGEDAANRERIAKLLRFASTHDRQRRADRVARRLRRPHEGRPGRDLLRHRRRLSPRRRTARTSRSSARRASKCCCCTDRVDEWVLSHLTEFDGKPLRVGRQGRPRPRQARGRGREEGAGRGRPGEYKELRRAHARARSATGRRTCASRTA